MYGHHQCSLKYSQAIDIGACLYFLLCPTGLPNTAENDSYTVTCLKSLMSKLADDVWKVCRKKIGPGQWDLSVAEHLQPGESYKEVEQTLV